MSAPCKPFPLGRVAGCCFPLFIALPSPSCSKRHASAEVGNVLHEWPAPASDPSPSCADVGDLRVCWDVSGGATTRVVPRPTPAASLSALGWRCAGVGAGRTCVDRTRDVPAFRCEGTRCIERHPRMPDDGEWECADFAGVVVCRGGERPAATPPGASDAAFTCGTRRGTQERLCVDLSPDFPDGSPRGWRCHFEPDQGLARICDRDAGAHVVTDACDPGHPCVSGLDCVAKRCVPREPSPTCWLPRDCDQGSCRFGSCIEGAP